MRGRTLKGNATPRRREVRDARGDDRGMAMIFVLGAITVMTIVGGVFSYAVNQQPAARFNEDWTAALRPPSPGSTHYVAKLNKSDGLRVRSGLHECGAEGSGRDQQLQLEPSTEPGWVNVKPGVSTAGQFHYDVNTSGILEERVGGLSPPVGLEQPAAPSRCASTRGGSTEFLYYTDFEDADPQNKGLHPSGAPATHADSAVPPSQILVADTQRVQRDPVRGVRRPGRQGPLQRHPADE